MPALTYPFCTRHRREIRAGEGVARPALERPEQGCGLDLSAHDWYTTFAALAGASNKVPTDRPIDGIDASKFLLGESPTSGRESLLFFGPDGSLMSPKWHNVKAVLRYSEGIDQPIVTPQWPRLFDLARDPGELYNLMATKMDLTWMLGVALKFVADYHKSVAAYPNIKTGEEFEGYEAHAPPTPR